MIGDVIARIAESCRWHEYAADSADLDSGSTVTAVASEICRTFVASCLLKFTELLTLPQ